MASSTGSDIFALSALVCICLVVLVLLRNYLPLRSTPAFVVLPIFLAIALPSSAIVLLPIDLASSARVEDESAHGIWLPQRVVLVSWRIIYWLTFMLTWIVLPLLGEYMDAGYRDPKARIIYSLRSNGRYQLIMLACIAVGLVYMILSYGFDFTAIKGVMMALAYGWGLILAIYLMGHGLVAVPRRMFRNADIPTRLKMVQAQAPQVHEKLEDSIITLEDIEAQIQQLQQRKIGTALDFQTWIDDLVDQVGQSPGRVTLATPGLDTASKIPNVITERYLADLTRRFNRARHQRARHLEEWDHIVRTASDLQAILDSKASRKLVFGQRRSSLLSRFSVLTPYLRYFLHVRILPTLRLLSGALLSVASIAIVWSEIIKFPAPQYSAISVTIAHRSSSEHYQIGFGGQLLAAIWIMYMVFCALSSMTVVPTWNQRALVHRNTSAESASWYAAQIAKLTVPLTYNFLTFLPERVAGQSTFHEFLGVLISLTPLGKWFNYLFPMFILIPVCAALFNLYGRIKRVLGFGIIEDNEDPMVGISPLGGWREGRDLIARDLNGSSHQSAIGLTSSPRASLDNSGGAGTRSGRSAPTLWVPPAERSNSQIRQSTGLGTSASARGQIRAAGTAQHQPVVLDQADDDDENFFTLFGKRVKNTLEQIEAPRWMQGNNNVANNGDTGNGGNPFTFKKPKWMGRGDDGAAGTSPSSPNIFERVFRQAGAGTGVSQDHSSRRGDGRIVL